VRKLDVKVCQEIIRATIKAAARPGKHLTTYGVIASLEDAIKYLERCAFATVPEDYLDDEEEGRSGSDDGD